MSSKRRSTPVPPEGLSIGRDQQWRIGRKIGDGVCGSVHELVDDENNKETDFCIKLAPLPNPALQTKKVQKERKKLADILHFESVMYRNQLVALQGSMIPAVPHRSTKIPITGDVDGYRFLVMERMQSGLDQVVQDARAGVGSFTLASIATSLFEIAQTVHETTNHLVIDVKPDNFMLSPSDDIVMLDLGLLKPYASGMGGHVVDTESGSVVGTPLYASLHLHDGHVPARRDDLEALCYMYMEFILGDLPWSHADSEDEIGALKQKTMEGSAVWTAIRNQSNAATSRALEEFYTTVHNLSFSKPPPYAELEALLQKLRFNNTTAKKKAQLRGSTKKPAQKKKPAQRRSTKRQEVVDVDSSSDEEDVKPTAQSSRSRRAAARLRRQVIDSDEEEPTLSHKRPSPSKQDSNRPFKRQDTSDVEGFYSATDDDDEGDFVSCADGEAMDWEQSNATTTNGARGVTLQITSGQSEGDSVSLTQGDCESITFGGREGYNLGESSEVRVDLQVHKKKLVTVGVTGSGAYVNDTKVKKTHKAFMNDVITIGETTIKVTPLQHQQQRVEVLNVVDMEAMDIDDNDEDIVEDVDDAKENMGPCVRLVGESIDLVLGAQTPLVLGTNVGASKNQAKLTLVVQKRMLSVHVKDLASSLSINGNKIRTEGKLFLGDKLSVGDFCTLTVTKASEETRKPASNKKTATSDRKQAATRLAPAKAAQGFLLSFTQGPYKGETIELTKSVVLGPKTARGATAFSLQKDTDATGTVKLDLLVQKKYCAVQVSGPVKINGSVVKGKQTAFTNDAISIGSSVLKVGVL